MNTYYIPRNVKGENRILFIFSTKGLIYTTVGLALGMIFYLIFSLLNLTIVGIIITIIFGLIGFSIGTFKVPDIPSFKMTQKTGGENLDNVIKRAIKFRRNKKIYVYTEEEEKSNG